MKPMDLVIGLRGTLVEEGHIPKTLIEAMESAYKYGNPWGTPKNKRAEWTKSLPEEIKVKDFSQGDRAEFLYFVGCTASSDPRIQEIAKSLAFVLHHAGVDFGILGNEEQCCGNEIRRMGEAGLFEELVEGNMERFESHQIERIITTCPHGFNVLKNEYPQGKFDVLHTIQLLAKQLEEGKLSFKQEIKKVVTYQPCFLE
jgi:Fe-S oxidoreductase